MAKKFNPNKPYGDVLGSSDEFPGAKYYQNGAYFNAHKEWIGGNDDPSTADDEKDIEIARLRAELAAARGETNPPGDSADDPPPPHGLSEEQYAALLEMGIETVGLSESDAKAAIISYAESLPLDGLKPQMKVSTMADKLIAAVG